MMASIRTSLGFLVFIVASSLLEQYHEERSKDLDTTRSSHELKPCNLLLPFLFVRPIRTSRMAFRLSYP